MPYHVGISQAAPARLWAYSKGFADSALNNAKRCTGLVSILNRYLFRETLLNWLGVTGVLLLILLSSRFSRYLGQAAAGELPGKAVFSLLGLGVVNYLTLLIPIGLLLGIMLALGRLYRDSEMAALMACGVGPRGLYKPILSLAAIMTAILFALALYFGPLSARQTDKVHNQAEKEARLSVFESGRFKSSDNGDTVFYARDVDDAGRLHDVFLHGVQNGADAVVTAHEGQQTFNADTGERTLVLHDGYRYQGTPGTTDYAVIKFGEHGVRMGSSGESYAENKVDFMPTPELLQRGGKAALAELEWRISIPIMAFVLALLAVPLAKTSPRQGRYGRLLAAILVYIIYSNLLGVARVWVEKGTLSPLIGLWWVHVLMLIGAIVLLFNQYQLWPGRQRQ